MDYEPSREGGETGTLDRSDSEGMERGVVDRRKWTLYGFGRRRDDSQDFRTRDLQFEGGSLRLFQGQYIYMVDYGPLDHDLT